MRLYNVMAETFERIMVQRLMVQRDGMFFLSGSSIDLPKVAKQRNFFSHQVIENA